MTELESLREQHRRDQEALANAAFAARDAKIALSEALGARDAARTACRMSTTVEVVLLIVVALLLLRH